MNIGEIQDTDGWMFDSTFIYINGFINSFQIS